jgi:hypothetical protein
MDITWDPPDYTCVPITAQRLTDQGLPGFEPDRLQRALSFDAPTRNGRFVVVGHQFADLLALVLAFTLLVLARGRGDCWSPFALQLITARDPEELQLQC